MKILVVDDNPLNRKLATQALSMGGHEVLAAESGGEGVKVALSQSPHLILMDINMPGMDGIEALKKIRAEKEIGKIPVIALTAFAMAGDMEKLLDEGFDDYISKPLNIAGLLDKVNSFASD